MMLVEGKLGAGSCELAAEMSSFIEEHQIHPQIARTYDFEEAREALEAMGNIHEAGKVVVSV